MRNVGGWGDRGQGSGRGGNNNSSVYAGRLIHGDEGDREIDRGGRRPSQQRSGSMGSGGGYKVPVPVPGHYGPAPTGSAALSHPLDRASIVGESVSASVGVSGGQRKAPPLYTTTISPAVPQPTPTPAPVPGKLYPFIGEVFTFVVMTLVTSNLTSSFFSSIQTYRQCSSVIHKRTRCWRSNQT